MDAESVKKFFLGGWPVILAIVLILVLELIAVASEDETTKTAMEIISIIVGVFALMGVFYMKWGTTEKSSE